MATGRSEKSLGSVLFGRQDRRATRKSLHLNHATTRIVAAELLETRELLTADVVTNWNEVLLDTIRSEKPAPPIASRAMAIVHTAIFDAVNSIDPEFEPYVVQLSPGGSASMEAAVASAAHRTLSSLFPGQKAVLDTALAATLASVPNGDFANRGVKLGNSVADAILTVRQSDGASDFVTYTPGTNPGNWRPTPTGLDPAVLPQWPNVTPFALNSGSQFRPAAPPALASSQYASDFNQVKDLGALTSVSRTADQTDTAKFWAGGPGTATPPGQWNMIAQIVAQNTATTIPQNARMFALLNVALADAGITAWDAKYEYDLWRPVTAIREADTDGNAATTLDVAWTPLLNTPAFPSYTSGHSTYSGAAAAVLKSVIGRDNFSFAVPSEANGVANRSFTSFTQAAEEAGMSRIYGGIHFNFDNTQGLSSGRNVGDFVVDTLLRPVVRINAGGPELNNGLHFEAGSTFENSAARSLRTRAAINMSGVDSDLPQSLFRSAAFDAPGGANLKFKVPTVVGAKYRVDLYFAEIAGNVRRPGVRKFDVAADGVVKIRSLDIFAEVGSNKALKKSFEVTGDGELNIELRRVLQNPVIAGLQVTQISGPTEAPNILPTVSAIVDQTIDEDTSTATLPFTLDDQDGDPLTVRATSSNPRLIYSNQIVISGSGANRTVKVTPRPNAFGQSNITLWVSDGKNSVKERFKVIVNPVDEPNTAPVISPIADQIVNGGTIVSIPFTVTDTDNDRLTVSASAADADVIRRVVVQGVGKNRTLVMNVGTALGTTEVTVSVNDGKATVTDAFSVSAGLRLNAGGLVNAVKPSFLDDRSYRNTGTIIKTKRKIDMTGVPSGIPAAVFRTNIAAPMPAKPLHYQIPLESGADYRVDLLFSEIQTGAFGVGKRVFDVTLDGQLKLDNLDIFAEVGANKGLVKSFNITSDGKLDIDFLRGVQNPAIAGIQVTRLDVSISNTTVRSISPTDGDEMISLTRETVVQFDGEVDPATVTNESLYLIAKGEHIPASIRVSSTGKTATVFYTDPLPESTEVRVVVDGDKIKDASGKLIDADGDGTAGGMATADFRTLPLTLIPGTQVFGYIYDSYNKNADGTDIPVVGATVFLDANPNIKAVTDASGFFELGLQDLNNDGTPDGLPSPEFFVHIDGSTAVNAPAGAKYATLGKPFHSVPGQRVQLRMDGSPVDVDPTKPGDQFHVYLPPMAMGDIVALSATSDTNVGFGPSVLSDARLAELFPNLTPAQQALLSEMRVTYPAGSAMNKDGTLATQAMVIPVNPDRLPAPLPAGVNPSLVVSVQAGTAAGFNLAGGSTNFDVPAPVTFPNLEGLLPGEKSLIWSFDHDAGKWVVIGTGTVSADGKSIDSDPGVGVLAPGWHFTVSGTQARIPIGGLDGKSDPFPGCATGTDFTSNDFPVLLTAGARDAVDLYESLASGPRPLTYQIDLQAALGFFAGRAGLDAYSHFIGGSGTEVPHGPGTLLGDLAAESNTVQGLVRDVNQQITDDLNRQAAMSNVITNESIDIDLPSPLSFGFFENEGLYLGFLKSVIGGTQGTLLEMTEFDATIDSYSKEAGGTATYSAKLQIEICDDFGVDEDDLTGGYLKFGPFNPLIPFWLLQHRTAGPKPFVNRIFIKDVPVTGTVNIPAGYDDAKVEIRGLATLAALPSASRLDAAVSTATGFGTENEVYYRIEVEGGATLAGRYNANTSPSNLVIAPNRFFTATFYQPSTNRSVSFSSFTSPSGEITDYSDAPLSGGDGARIKLENFGGNDADGDQVPDVGEYVLGTRPESIDSDGDGISDAAELTQGTNPLDGTGFPTGLISSLRLRGSSESVAVAGQQIYVATGNHGLAIVDGSRFDNPIVLGELDLNGTSTDVSIDEVRKLAVVATGLSVQIVDVADPMVPSLKNTVTTSAKFVEVVDGFAYAVGGTTLSVIDLVQGSVIAKLTLPGSGDLTGFVREGSRLYAFLNGTDTLSVIDISKADQPLVAGQIHVDIASSDVGLFAGNQTVWLAGSGLRTVDATDPANLRIVGQPQQNADFFTSRRVALNGSGLGLVAPDGGNSITLYDTSDRTKTGADRLLTTFQLTGDARDIAISRGVAYVAAGNRLEVINYRPFDSQGQAPTVQQTVQATDINPATATIEVLEGTRIPVTVATTDDVQVRQVEILVNGQVIQTDVSFPFDAIVTAPLISVGGTSLRVQTRATDTGGNQTLSPETVITVTPDIFPPVVESVTPTAGGQVREGKRVLRVRINEPVNADRVKAAGVIRIVGAGIDDTFGTADDVNVAVTVDVRDDGRLIQIATDTLSSGSYELRLDKAKLQDISGNAAGVGDFTSRFTATKVTPRLVGNPPTAAFVIDVSGSTADPLGATGIGDRNNDGTEDSILDAEIAGMEILNQELINLGFGATAQVSIVTFDSSASSLDMDPVADGIQLTTTPLADRNGNGIRDVEEILRSLRTGGGTNFESPFQTVVSNFATLAVPNGSGNIFFISDGDGGGGFEDEVQQLRGQNHAIAAFAAGDGARLDLLQQMDPSAARFTTTDGLLDLFLQAADGAAQGARVGVRATIDETENDRRAIDHLFEEADLLLR